MRTAPAFLLMVAIVCLTACNRGVQNNDAVRQGVLDYLSQKAGMNVAAMDINLASAKITGNQADATVTFAAKGSSAVQMTIQYHLEQKDNKWSVVGRQDTGQHGVTQAPSQAPNQAPAGNSPHGAGAIPADPHSGGGGKMPAPEDLPPAGKKK